MPKPFPRALRRALPLAAIAVLALTVAGPVAATADQPRAERVAAVQRALGIPADGIAGPQTRRAIKRFQRSHGLTVDGVVGPQTLRALGLDARQASSSGDSALLARIAECESGGDPAAVSPDGRYRGKYQFSRATWRSLGGSGDPAAASESEQDRRAADLLHSQGRSAWPVCAS